MAKSIHYITRDPWWDTDRTLLPELTALNTVRISVENGTGSLKYPVKEAYSAAELNVRNERYHYYDPRILFSTWKYCRNLARVSDNTDATVFVMGGSPFYLVFSCLLLDADRTVIAVHNYEQHNGGRRSLAERLIYRKFRHFLFFSELQKKAFGRSHPDMDSTAVRMPLKTFGAAERKEGRGVPRFLFFGFIRDYKRLDLFIEAAEKTDADADFIIAGKGDWEKYDEMIGDDRRFICRRGFISDGEAAELYASADFLVLPYRDATQSGPALTAMSYSLPVICSDIPFFSSIVEDGVNGFLFDAGDADALAAVMERAARMGPEQYSAMREAQRAKAAEYSSGPSPAKAVSDYIEGLRRGRRREGAHGGDRSHILAEDIAQCGHQHNPDGRDGPDRHHARPVLPRRTRDGNIWDHTAGHHHDVVRHDTRGLA